jgi:hypothetical protein
MLQAGGSQRTKPYQKWDAGGATMDRIAKCQCGGLQAKVSGDPLLTLPGEQFVIRRKAYAMIKKAFHENGIKFAFPTVQVAGEGEPALPRPRNTPWN